MTAAFPDRPRKTTLPLEGLRVIELGSVIAGPFCGSLLADFGACVVKVERPEGDPGRHLGASVDGVSVWWGVCVRDKFCVTLDLKDERDRERLLELVDQADVLVENNRAGALDRLGLGWSGLHRRNPRLIMLSISGFGQDGPLSHAPGFGKIAEGLSGIVPLTGDPGHVPLHVGFSLADATASLFGLMGVIAALWDRDGEGGEGRQIDLGLYEPLLRLMDVQAAQLQPHGEPALRQGTNDPYGWGAADHDRRFVSVLCADGAEILVLVDAQAVSRIVTLTASDAEPRQALVAWAAQHSSDSAAAALRETGIEAARVQDGGSLARDPYFRGRGDVAPAALPSGRSLMVPGHLLRSLSAAELCPFRSASLADDQKLIFADFREPEN